MASIKRRCTTVLCFWCKKNGGFCSRFCCLSAMLGWSVFCIFVFFVFLFVDEQKTTFYPYKLVRKFLKYQLACKLTIQPSAVRYEQNISESCRTVANMNDLKAVLNRQQRTSSTRFVCYKSARVVSSIGLPIYGKPLDTSKISSKLRRILTGTNLRNFSKEILMVTAASSNHFGEFRKLVDSWREFCSQKRLHFVDLGLTTAELDTIRNVWQYAKLSVDKFNFKSYPNFVGNLFEYRWKLLLLVELSEQYSDLIWLDASFRFQQSTCETFATHSGNSRVESPVKMYLNPMHSILSTTNPKLYEYFPADLQTAKHTNMFGGGILMLRRSPSLTLMMFWWALCALTENCLSPPGSVIKCHWNKINNVMINEYSCCHRFDMSLINVLLYDKFGSTDPYYSDRLNFMIIREFFNY